VKGIYKLKFERRDTHAMTQNKMLQLGTGVQKGGERAAKKSKRKDFEKFYPSAHIKQNSRRRRSKKIGIFSLCKFVHPHITAPSLIPNVVSSS
jgi:hypothetical protein